MIVGKILENPKYGYGYNAQTLAYGDLVAEGVIDPTKVVRSALQGAASVAGLLVTTEAIGGGAAEEGVRTSSDARRRHGRDGLLRLKSPGHRAGALSQALNHCAYNEPVTSFLSNGGD